MAEISSNLKTFPTVFAHLQRYIETTLQRATRELTTFRLRWRDYASEPFIIIIIIIIIHIIIIIIDSS